MWIHEKFHNLRKLNPFAHKLKLGQADGIYSPEEFAAILGRERARSDRSRKSFSLVIFTFDDRADDALYWQLIGVIARRIRVVDDLGWFQEKCLAVSLPYTQEEGAKIFSEGVLKAMRELSVEPNVEIFYYPRQWIEGKGATPPDSFDTSGPDSGFDMVVKDFDEADPEVGPSVDNSAMNFQRLLPTVNKRKLSAHVKTGIPVWKRTIDILGALVGMILVFPFLLPVALYIKLVSRGPVLFRQQRVGFKGVPFTMYKLRTMHEGGNSERHRKFMAARISGDEANMPVSKLDDDPVIIPLGVVIRKLCLDEFPQLINVLKGDMSLVGPRPPIPYEVQAYLRWHASRFDTVPGITGLWQVSGKNNLTFREMVCLDIAYIRRRTFFLDLWILLKTPFAIVRQCIEGFSHGKLNGSAA